METKDPVDWRLTATSLEGTKVRYEPDWVVINTPTAFRTVMGPKGNNDRSQMYSIFTRRWEVPATIQVIGSAEHGRKRRMLANAFSEKAVRGFEPFVISNVERWCELLEDEIPKNGGWSESINMADWLNWLVFDVMGDLCLGRSFDMKEKDSDMRYLIDLMADMMAFIYPVSARPCLPSWPLLLEGVSTKLLLTGGRRAANKQLDQPVPHRTTLGLAQTTRFGPSSGIRLTQRRTAMVALARKCSHGAHAGGRRGPQGFNQDPQGLFPLPLQGQRSRERRRWTLQRRALGGAPAPGHSWRRYHGYYPRYGPIRGFLSHSKRESTANRWYVTAAVFFHLTRNADVSDRLTAEILDTFDSVSEIVTGPKLNSCKYLKAVIQEGLRMAPPVTADFGRQVRAGGVVVDGDFFPEGTHVTVCPWALSYSEEVFAEPLRFRPERWIAGEKGVDVESVEAAEKALTAFSAGARGCIGKNLAWMEMTLVLARIVYLFEMRRTPGNNLGGGDPLAKGFAGRRKPEQYQLYDGFVAQRDGPLVQLKRRAT